MCQIRGRCWGHDKEAGGLKERKPHGNGWRPEELEKEEEKERREQEKEEEEEREERGKRRSCINGVRWSEE